jgi:hypothetical protein
MEKRMSRFISHYDEKTGLTIWTVNANGIGGYYYKCRQAPEGYGPFQNQQEVFRHYHSVLKSTQVYVLPTAPIAKNNVIEVDFKARKRIG